MEIIKGVNFSKEIYRYDCKDKIMYFNHKEANQDKLNTMITKAFNMSEEVVGCRIERREPGGMGGMGGMGMGARMGLDTIKRR